LVQLEGGDNTMAKLILSLEGSVIREIPITFHERGIGKSKLGHEDIKEFITFLCTALFSRAKHIFDDRP